MPSLSLRAVSTFEVVSWEEAAAEVAGDTTLGRATVRKVFRGDLEGHSVAFVLTCRVGETPAAYVAQERITGTLASRGGSFVVQHGSPPVGGEPGRALGTVVPGTATGDLAGLHGRIEYEHDERGARCTFDYRFSEP
jgi:hypothetical protein